MALWSEPSPWPAPSSATGTTASAEPSAAVSWSANPARRRWRSRSRRARWRSATRSSGAARRASAAWASAPGAAVDVDRSRWRRSSSPGRRGRRKEPFVGDLQRLHAHRVRGQLGDELAWSRRGVVGVGRRFLGDAQVELQLAGELLRLAVDDLEGIRRWQTEHAPGCKGRRWRRAAGSSGTGRTTSDRRSSSTGRRPADGPGRCCRSSPGRGTSV